MSKIVEGAVRALNDRLGGAGFDGSVRFDIEDEGSVRIDKSGASADAGEADCIITASAETFQGLLAGDLSPTAAFMTGKLKVEGDMGLAMKLGSVLG